MRSAKESSRSARPPKLVLGFGNPTEPALTRWITLIKDLLGTPRS
jgi:hypothetical protein